MRRSYSIKKEGDGDTLDSFARRLHFRARGMGRAQNLDSDSDCEEAIRDTITIHCTDVRSSAPGRAIQWELALASVFHKLAD